MGRAPKARVSQPRITPPTRSLSARDAGRNRRYSSLMTITGSISAGWLGRNRMPWLPFPATASIPRTRIR